MSEKLIGKDGHPTGRAVRKNNRASFRELYAMLFEESLTPNEHEDIFGW